MLSIIVNYKYVLQEGQRMSVKNISRLQRH